MNLMDWENSHSLKEFERSHCEAHENSLLFDIKQIAESLQDLSTATKCIVDYNDEDRIKDLCATLKELSELKLQYEDLINQLVVNSWELGALYKLKQEIKSTDSNSVECS